MRVSGLFCSSSVNEKSGVLALVQKSVRTIDLKTMLIEIIKTKKLDRFMTVALFILVTFLSFASPNIKALANQDVSFHCIRGGADGYPRTIALVSGTEYDVIIWSRLYNPRSAATIQGVYDRCSNTSRNFQRAYNEGLYYVTSELRNRRSVICASSREGGSCGLVLFNLDRRDNASLTLRRLFDMSSLTPSSFPLDQNQRIYIDIRDVISR